MAHILDDFIFHNADGSTIYLPADGLCPHCSEELSLLEDLPAYRAYFGCRNDSCPFFLQHTPKKRFGCIGASRPPNPSYP